MDQTARREDYSLDQDMTEGSGVSFCRNPRLVLSFPWKRDIISPMYTAIMRFCAASGHGRNNRIIQRMSSFVTCNDRFYRPSGRVSVHRTGRMEDALFQTLISAKWFNECGHSVCRVEKDRISSKAQMSRNSAAPGSFFQ